MIEYQLEKIASELDKIDEIIAYNTLEKIAFVKEILKKTEEEETLKKEAAPSISPETLNTIRNVAQNTGRILGSAMLAGIGLGIAGEVINSGHKSLKKMLFKSKEKRLINEIKKSNPSLQKTKDEDIKKLLEAGYTIAPALMENPTIAASFISIGKSLGGQVDPNTIKLFADANYRAKDRVDTDLINLGLGLTR